MTDRFVHLMRSPIAVDPALNPCIPSHYQTILHIGLANSLIRSGNSMRRHAGALAEVVLSEAGVNFEISEHPVERIWRGEAKYRTEGGQLLGVWVDYLLTMKGLRQGRFSEFPHDPVYNLKNRAFFELAFPEHADEDQVRRTVERHGFGNLDRSERSGLLSIQGVSHNFGSMYTRNVPYWCRYDKLPVIDVIRVAEPMLLRNP